MSVIHPGETFLASDKDEYKKVNNGILPGFGGNHQGEGGHVLKVQGSVQWHRTQEWGDKSANGGYEQILGGADLGIDPDPGCISDF